MLHLLRLYNILIIKSGSLTFHCLASIIKYLFFLIKAITPMTSVKIARLKVVAVNSIPQGKEFKIKPVKTTMTRLDPIDKLNLSKGFKSSCLGYNVSISIDPGKYKT